MYNPSRSTLFRSPQVDYGSIYDHRKSKKPIYIQNWWVKLPPPRISYWSACGDWQMKGTQVSCQIKYHGIEPKLSSFFPFVAILIQISLNYPMYTYLENDVCRMHSCKPLVLDITVSPNSWPTSLVHISTFLSTIPLYSEA